MRYGVLTGFFLAWALWLGSLVMAMTGAQMYFATDRDLAPRAASLLFLHMEKVQAIAAVAAVSLAAILLVLDRRRLHMLLLVAVLLPAILATISTTTITPRIEQMRRSAQTQSPDFKRLHGISMALLLGEAVLLTACGFILPTLPSRSERMAGNETRSSGEGDHHA